MSRSKEIGPLMQRKIRDHINKVGSEQRLKADSGSRVVKEAVLEKVKEISSYREIESAKREYNEYRSETEEKIKELEESIVQKRREVLTKFSNDVFWDLKDMDRYARYADERIQINESRLLLTCLQSIFEMSPQSAYEHIIRDHCNVYHNKLYQCALKVEAKEVLKEFHDTMPMYHAADDVEEIIDELLLKSR